MKLALIGTDLAPVATGAGAIETLLAGWAGELGRLGHEVHVISRFPAVAEGPYRVHTAASTDELAPLLRGLAPDVSVLNNRPLWRRFAAGPTAHLFHNYPDAWAASEDDARRALGHPTSPPVVIGAVSSALAGEVTRVLELPAPSHVAVVSPFVADDYFAVRRRPVPGRILFPNRLMAKKGVRETLAASRDFVAEGFDFRFLNYISPWLEPTAEHRRLQAEIRAAAGCHLWPPVTSPAEMAGLYATAQVVLCPAVRPEGFGLTAIEAQACGVPVVSSGLGGLSEAQLLPDLLVDPTDAASLSAGIRRAVTVSPAVQRGLRGRVATRFSRSRSAATLLAWLMG